MSDQVIPQAAATRLLREGVVRFLSRIRAALAELADDESIDDHERARRWAQAVDCIAAEEQARARAEVERWSAPVSDWERALGSGTAVVGEAEALDDFAARASDVADRISEDWGECDG